MARRSKRYLETASKVDRNKAVTLEEGIRLVKETATAKFDETVEIAARLGVDPRHADQMVRGTVVLPHGVGKEVKVLVLTRGEKEKEAIEAGADYVGSDEYIDKIQKGWADVDVIIATPDIMPEVGKLGRILGPKRLMPNPKSGTVTLDVVKAVKEAKGGKIEYRVDRSGNVHAPIGKVSFEEEKLCENARTFIEAILRAKPLGVRGRYLLNLTLSTTMGPGIRLDRQAIMNMFR